MPEREMVQTLHYKKNQWQQDERVLPVERPWVMTVNGRELVTLMASPHDPRALVYGFLYLQGLIDNVDEVLSLGICLDSGQIAAQISGEVPGKLQPAITSGCGAGLSFKAVTTVKTRVVKQKYAVADIFALHKRLVAQAELYRTHGGIHAAAIRSGETVIHSEDIGRHNAVDRVAGLALQHGLATEGGLLVVSGRVSSELIGKAARLGVSVIATRSAATDLAVRAAMEAGMAVVGYVRGDALEIYTGHDLVTDLVTD